MQGLRHRKLVNKRAPRNEHIQESNAASGINSERSNASAAGVNSERSNAAGGSVHSERSNAGDGVNFERSNATAGGVNSERSNAAGGCVNSERSNATDGVNSQRISEDQVSGDPPKRGRARMCRTKMRLPPRGAKVQLEPIGHSQFTYVNYNPKGYKYPSLVGVILKRLYPGVIKIYDDHANEVAERPAYSWNDYYNKKNGRGFSYARLVKQEFWNVFTVRLADRRRANRNLENYLVRRVTNMMHQVRLEAIKKYFCDRGEECDDTRARSEEFTEEQYLACRLEWCTEAAWALLAHYWTSDEFKQKRRRAQESRLNSEDPVQNRGGSRNFSETQQYLEFTYGPGKGSTINTYAVMKSRVKNVDDTGSSGPITSRKAQKLLNDYKAAVPDENSKQLDGRVLYSIGHGLRHGRFPIGDGVVDKVEVLASVKSMNVKPTKFDCCRSLIHENEQLKETNEILIEENSVNHELIMRFYADFGREPPTDLLKRLADIDARRHQDPGTSQAASDSDVDMHNNLNNDDNGGTDHDGDDHNDGETGYNVEDNDGCYSNNGGHDDFNE